MKKDRIVIVDAVRGFALLGIVLIHFVEHFELFSSPQTRWLIPEEFDSFLYDFTYWMVSGKAYSIFALMFGYSFFIQINNQERRGIDFRGKFFWRLVLLLMMGIVHSLVYRGDILHIYALLGMPLILLYKVRTKVLIWVAILLLLQIPTLFNIGIAFSDPTYVYTQDYGDNLWGKVS